MKLFDVGCNDEFGNPIMIDKTCDCEDSNPVKDEYGAWYCTECGLDLKEYEPET